MSSQYFEDLEVELKDIIQELDQTLDNSIPCLIGDVRIRTMKNAEKRCDEADSLVHQMLVEARSAHPSFRAELQGKAESYQSHVNHISSRLKALTYGERNELLGGAAGVVSTPDPFYNKMQENINTMRSTSASLNRAQEISAETSQVCDGVMDDLQDQRQQLIKSKARLREADENVKESGRILTRIACGVAKSKIVVAVVIIIEVIILGGVLYWKLSPS